MIISKTELLGLYQGCYDRAEQAKIITKEIGEDLKGYAEHNEIDAKAVKSGYQTFKKYRSGGINPGDDALAEILTIVEDSFGG